MDNKGINYETFTLHRDFTIEQFLNKFGRGSTFPQVNYKNENVGGMKDCVKFIMANGII